MKKTFVLTMIFLSFVFCCAYVSANDEITQFNHGLLIAEGGRPTPHAGRPSAPAPHGRPTPDYPSDNRPSYPSQQGYDNQYDNQYENNEQYDENAQYEEQSDNQYDEQYDNQQNNNNQDTNSSKKDYKTERKDLYNEAFNTLLKKGLEYGQKVKF